MSHVPHAGRGGSSDPPAIHRYRSQILDELARHGLRPRPDTSPRFLRDAVNDLYRHEIRVLRDRCRAGEFPTRDLPARVIELRKRYILLSIPIENWTIQGA